MDLVDQGELLEYALLLQHEVGLLARQGALQLLAGEQLLLDSLPSLFAGLLVHRVGVVRIDEDFLPVVIVERAVQLFVEMLARKGLGALAIAPTVARGNEIGHTTALHEGVVLDTVEEHLAELGHLAQTDAEEGGFGVAPEVESIDEPGTEGDDVLERAANLGAGHVADVLDAEGRGVVEDEAGQLVGGRAKVAGEGRFAHLAERHLRRDVGPHQDAALKVVAHGLLDGAADEDGILGVGAEVCMLQVKNGRKKNIES